MARVTGIGGVFFKCKDKAALVKWYEDVLGFVRDEDGAFSFMWADDKKPDAARYSVWGPFKEETDYFAPSQSPFMVNLRVDNLKEFVIMLETKGVELCGDMLDESYGKFAWIVDPEGTKIELWEAVPMPEA
jgi:catechol 2,3-dioxygenase-like lactoylglutathione lyase family enzyme